jgi:putative heme iron utilization protein
MSHGIEARRLLRRCRSGSLGTISRRLPGYPYVSIVPFMLDHDANPIVLISRLAEHTKNIGADERVSLAAQELADDVQACARLTLCGICLREERPTAVAARYQRYLPNATPLLDLDFEFCRISPVALRYIGGFGAVHWISAQAFRPPANSIADIEDDFLAHVNCDHARALHDYCRHRHNLSASKVTMIGVDCDGFDVRADEKLVRFDFRETVHDAQTLRSAIAELARESRS